jgi:hypothetical protein
MEMLFLVAGRKPEVYRSPLALRAAKKGRSNDKQPQV